MQGCGYLRTQDNPISDKVAKLMNTHLTSIAVGTCQLDDQGYSYI